jgi:hypothetical protein
MGHIAGQGGAGPAIASSTGDGDRIALVYPAVFEREQLWRARHTIYRHLEAASLGR